MNSGCFLVNLTDDAVNLRMFLQCTLSSFHQSFLRYTHSLVLWLFLPQMVQLAASEMLLVLFMSYAFR